MLRLCVFHFHYKEHLSSVDDVMQANKSEYL